MTEQERKRLEGDLNFLEDNKHPEPSPRTQVLCVLARILLSIDRSLEVMADTARTPRQK